MMRQTGYPLLVIDAGNSAIKFAMVARAGATPKLVRSVPTGQLTIGSAKRIGARRKSVAVSSVVPSASRILKGAFPEAVFIGPRTELGFKTMADRRATGSDRIANVAAVQARYGKNVLVASFGTAATFDIIDANGVHRGGAIAPGWRAFSGILPARTALLPRVVAKTATRSIGRNTREALRAGVAGGYAAMVTRIIDAMKDEAGVKQLRVVFTGGDAAIVAGLLPWKSVIDPLLTLRGINLLAGQIARKGGK